MLRRSPAGSTSKLAPYQGRIRKPLQHFPVRRRTDVLMDCKAQRTRQPLADATGEGMHWDMSLHEASHLSGCELLALSHSQEPASCGCLSLSLRSSGLHDDRQKLRTSSLQDLTLWALSGLTESPKRTLDNYGTADIAKCLEVACRSQYLRSVLSRTLAAHSVSPLSQGSNFFESSLGHPGFARIQHLKPQKKHHNPTYSQKYQG